MGKLILYSGADQKYCFRKHRITWMYGSITVSFLQCQACHISINVQISAQIFLHISGYPLALIFQIKSVRVLISIPVHYRADGKLTVNTIDLRHAFILLDFLEICFFKILPGLISGNIPWKTCGKIFRISGVFI